MSGTASMGILDNEYNPHPIMRHVNKAIMSLFLTEKAII
jgi:hypothetical protein